MLDKSTAEAFANDWIASWNSHDLDRILDHYAEHFEFSSPFILQIASEPSGVLRGKHAVRAYWAKALARIPDLQFRLESVLWSINSLVIIIVTMDTSRRSGSSLGVTARSSSPARTMPSKEK